MEIGNRLRGADSGVRRTALLLLLALRARPRSVHAERGLRRPRRLRKSEGGSCASNGRLSPDRGAGVRAEAGSDRTADRGESYLHLEVCDRRRPGSIGRPTGVSRWGIFIPPRPFVDACALSSDPLADSPAVPFRSAAASARTA